MGYPVCKIGFNDFVKVEDEIWFCDIYRNRLVKMDLQMRNIKTVVPLGKRQLKMSYGSIFNYKDRIVLIPRNADNILIYNLHGNDITEIPLRENSEVIGRPWFIKAIAYQDNIYLFPARFGAVVKLNMETLTVTYLDEIIQIAKNYKSDKKGIYFNCIAMVEHYCFMPLYETNVMVRFDLQTEYYDFIEYDDVNHRILSAFGEKNKIWLAGFEKGVLEYDLNKGTLEKHVDFGNLKELEEGISDILNLTDKILVFPMNESRILLYEKRTGRYQTALDFPLLDNKERRADWAITGCDVLGPGFISPQKVIFFSAYFGKICKIDLECLSIDVQDGRINDAEEISSIMRKSIKSGQVLYEKEWGLEMLLNNM